MGATLATWLDIVLQLAGLACVIVISIQFVRGRGRDLHLSVHPTMNLGPGLLVAGLVTFAYFLLQSLFVGVMPIHAGPSRIEAGSLDWNLLNLADTLAKLLATGIILLFLRVSMVRSGFDQTQAPGSGPIVCFLAFLASLPLCYSQATVTDWVWRFFSPGEEPPEHQVLQAFAGNVWGDWGRLLLVTVAVVVAPIAEEVYFRGLILGGLLQVTRLPWVSIALSAAVFGAAHAAQPQVVAPIVTLGLILGYVRLRMNSLRLCIAIHALFNGRTMALILLDPSQLR